MFKVDLTKLMRNVTLGTQLHVLSASEALEIEEAEGLHVFVQVRSEFIRDEINKTYVEQSNRLIVNVNEGQLPLY